MSLEGRIALITGSTRGIGWATARCLAAGGATVVLHGRRRETVDQRCDELRASSGSTVAGMAYDAADPDAVANAFTQLRTQFSQLDILVNNAGIMCGGALGMIRQAAIDETFGVNVSSVIHHTQEAARLMGRRKSGAIINIASLLGQTGSEGQSVYAASKAAIVGLTKSAAKELAPRGIRVNAVAPGMIDTDLLGGLPPPRIQALVERIPLKRLGAPEDVASVVAFLASDGAAYITGAVIAVDGGLVL